MNGFLTANDVDMLYKSYRHPIKAYLIRRGCPFDRSDDLLHEAFLKLLQRIGKVQVSRGLIPSILYWMAGDVLNDQVFRKREAAPLGDCEIQAPENNDVQARLLLQILEDAVCDPRLSRLQRQVLDLRFFAERPVKEVAELLGVSVRSVFREWKRVKQYLRERLEEQGMEPDQL